MEYLDHLRDYYAEHRVLPSFSGIAKLVGLGTTSAVAALVKRLKDSGHLESTPDRRLQPGKRFLERSLADTVQAGAPCVANDNPVQGLEIDAYLVDSPSRTVLLTVKGDSMVDAGLLEGDNVVVKKNAPVKPGDIVVAIVDDAFTIKYLQSDKSGFYLKPGNKAYSAIRAKDHLEIFGLVVGSFRKY